MGAEIKFCGMTRAEDAEFAATLGAAYVGVIFAGGPRMVSMDQAAAVLSVVPRSVGRVGVFGRQSAADVARTAANLDLDVIQLHDETGADVGRIASIRRAFDGELWFVCRMAGVSLPTNLNEFIAQVDGILLDAHVPGLLGGTGVPIPWAEVSAGVAPLRSRGQRLILAGGLRPQNVAAAISALAPDVVDVSSGVETAPGIKDHARMRAFRDAVAVASIPA